MAHSRTDLESLEGVIAPSPQQQIAVLQLLAALEAQPGVGELKRVEPRKIGDLPNLWPWSWEPDAVMLFMAGWDTPALLVIPKLRELAYTETPDGKALMYERACRLDVRKAISDAKVILSEPIGNIPPYPKGDCSYDTRYAPPGHKAGSITINYWHIRPGVIRGISPSFRDQIAEIHGRDVAEKVRLAQGFDHMNSTINI